MADHLASECRAASRCLLCTEAGRKADHKMGGVGCNLMTGRVPPTPIARRRIEAAKPDIPGEVPTRMEVEVEAQQQSQQDPPKEQRTPRERLVRRNTVEEQEAQDE